MKCASSPSGFFGLSLGTPLPFHHRNAEQDTGVVSLPGKEKCQKKHIILSLILHLLYARTSHMNSFLRDNHSAQETSRKRSCRLFWRRITQLGISRVRSGDIYNSLLHFDKCWLYK
uniref:Uncharacterized protein n=1 Tax=Solanum lycopersicum TaxID=4081 RepID=A0A3Q7ITZ7_SOLLC